MSEDERPGTDEWLRHETEHFRPLRREGPAALWLTLVLGPATWVLAAWAVAVLVRRTHAIAFGLAIALVAFAVSLVTLTLLRVRRDREEARYRHHARS